jgi:hypothetical protein
METPMYVDLDVLESEHLIGRLKLIELLERQSPYRDLRDGVERRFSQALRVIPNEFRQPAIAIFGSVQYIGKQMLFDAWRYLWSLLNLESRDIPSLEDVSFLELDRDQLRDEFYRANSLTGRLQDNLPWRSAHDIIDALMGFESGHIAPELTESFSCLSKKRCWVLLVDLSISGTSAVSELRRLHKIRSLFFDQSNLEIIALIQLATETALQALGDSGYRYHCAIKIPNHQALNDVNYNLYGNSSLQESMREICKWFAEEHVLKTNYRLATMSLEQKNSDIAAFGFGGLGWSIVTHRNTPNNSLPLLWFRPPGEVYRPPFERIDSRIGKPWAGRSEWLTRVEASVTQRQIIIDAMQL